jgi:hypothetical protein
MLVNLLLLSVAFSSTTIAHCTFKLILKLYQIHYFFLVVQTFAYVSVELQILSAV